jgi:hypothetical protein
MNNWASEPSVATISRPSDAILRSIHVLDRADTRKGSRSTPPYLHGQLSFCLYSWLITHTYCSQFRVTLRLRPWQPQLLHFDRQLKNIVDTLALRLRLVHVISPNISASRQQSIPHQSTLTPNLHSMPLDQYRITVWIFLHGRLKTLPQVLLMRRVLDDRYPQAVIVA